MLYEQEKSPDNDDDRVDTNLESWHQADKFLENFVKLLWSNVLEKRYEQAKKKKKKLR